VDREVATGKDATVGDFLEVPKEWRRYARLACALPEAELNDWYKRVDADQMLGDLDDWVESITALARLDGLHGVDELYVLAAVHAPAKTPEAESAHFRLLEALFNDRWTFATGGEPSWVWQELAISLLERGEASRAAEVVGRITDALSIVALRADNRFLAIVQANPERFDVPRAYARDVEEKRAAAAKQPRLMEAQTALIRALRDSYRFREALDVADELLTRVDSSPVAPYDDVAKSLPWAMDARSSVLRKMGRFDEALAQLERAAKLSEEGEPNVSQAINLADLRNDLGHPKEALEALEGVTQVTPYGRMELEGTRAQAAVQLHDDAVLERSLTYLREHVDDAPDALESALLAANRLDEAAKVFISRLENPKQRIETLLNAQTFPETPRSPVDRIWHDRRRKLLNRPDVQAAIARFGRIERYELPTR
jgi:tetratricopeptide (TPR) repeat protein